MFNKVLFDKVSVIVFGLMALTLIPIFAVKVGLAMGIPILLCFLVSASYIWVMVDYLTEWLGEIK